MNVARTAERKLGWNWAVRYGNRQCGWIAYNRLKFHVGVQPDREAAAEGKFLDLGIMIYEVQPEGAVRRVRHYVRERVHPLSCLGVIEIVPWAEEREDSR